jgi:pimeloyl-ACP methyl ester carboxylesterase
MKKLKIASQGGRWITLVGILLLGGFAYRSPLGSWVSERLRFWQLGITRFKSPEGLSGLSRRGCAGNYCTCVGLIHGAGGESADWEKLLTLPLHTWILPVDFYAFDLNDNEVGPKATGQKILAGLNHFGRCQRWVLVGHSWGGWVAGWAAIEAAPKLSAVLLEDSAGFSKEHKPTDRYAGDFFDAQLAQISIPTTVLWGMQDWVLYSRFGRELSAKIPHARFIEQPNCGHLPHKECPGALVQALNDLLKRI